ncbi:MULTISPECIES: polysaccharide biosynthesis/export family protein [Pseudoalteromonas]|uniref:polysaccharide biosynthesis/export family protein n=1 Tax=Pseudoalteromonas TaxID=53246 RepID=UPI00249B6A19|nr:MULTISPECIES: polysaccharide biosynthesis/export family protein [Pseudoalteromonas]MDI3244581.1 polysaccharide biosynthesis/export family protein [Pseudoalteromonas agarivorans]MDO6548911.1 polysaccharide biosynthesis/export family protein [Pseudoalteromonas carrageenovora]MDO6833416.1 polysaccharide biosynthesis/export family protein [Pseudoalteromonas carrageenovora]WRU73542.1 polysaccharide biosynthesis/export family protein [Pseudoalteromonas sp. CuT 4-3]
MNTFNQSFKLIFNLIIGASIIVSLNLSAAEQMSLTQLENAGTTQTQLPNAELQNGTFSKQGRSGTLLPGEMSAAELLPSSEQGLPPPYGANLFAGGYESERLDGLNDDYTVAPGDKVSIWLWGAINQSEVVTVDNQGNLFITNVGPVYVADVKASQLNTYVSNKIKEVYKKSVQIYVNLLTATPVSVYISGSVIRPGQYAGIASDSILYYLKRAGGIDSERGSYRSIKVLRNNKVIQNIDLYDFILTGYLPKFNFKDNDVILVERQKATVVVSGSVRAPFRFEFLQSHATGEQLAKFALPLAKVSHVGVVGDRADGPFSVYLPYNEFKNFELKDGDRLIFNDDMRAQVIDIQVDGSYLGPSYFAVNKNTRLHDLLAHIQIDKSLADYQSIYIQRKSVAKKQKEMIDQSLERLERSVFTAPASSDGEAKIRAEEGKMILEFTERARKIIPLGKVVIADQGQVANIRLEQGDIIHIPAKTDLIHIGGEVLMPQALVYNPNATIDDYIAWAGGYSERANYDQIMVIHPNGMIDLDAYGTLKPGDQILVLPKVDTKFLQSVKDITQIIYQIAIAANVAT